MRRGLAALLAATLGATGLWLAPAEAITWPAPATVSGGSADSLSPDVVVTPDGTTVAAWQRDDGANTRIETSFRAPGSAWSAPAYLSAAGQDANSVDLAVGSNGVVVATWRRGDGIALRIQASVRTAQGTWGTPSTLSTLGPTADHTPAVAVGPDGSSAVVWRSTDNRILTSTMAPGASWTPAQLLSDIGTSSAPQVVIGADGTATATWHSLVGPVFRIQVATKSAAGPWSSPFTLSDASGNAQLPFVATGPDGTTTLVFLQFEVTNFVVRASERQPGGLWTSPVGVSTPGTLTIDARVTVLPDGTAAASWARSDGAVDRIEVSTRSPQGTWSTPTTVSPAGQFATDPLVAAAPDGSLLATWLQFDGNDNRALFARRTPGGSWEPAVTLSDAGENGLTSRVAVGDDGTAVALWRRTDGSFVRVLASVVDDAFPPPPLETGKITGKKKLTKAKGKYAFTSPTPGATFECRVDKKFKKYAGVSKKKAKKQVPWTACTSPYVVKAKKLKPGKHKLYVRAILNGRTDPTPSVKKLKIVQG